MNEVMQNPWLNGLVIGALTLTVLMTAVGWITWFERKFAGRLQNRMGPTIVGPFGLLQPIADIVKALQKESIIPTNADAFLFKLAPPLFIALALGTAAVIPFAPGVLSSDLEIGVLYALGLSGLMSFPVWMAGWASNNKYALMGGMRMVAQGISYEIPMVLSALVPVVLAGSLSMADIVEYQHAHGWFIAWPPGPGVFAFLVFFMTSLAEGNRIPFDIPEAESELVAGPTTEYNAIGWSIFAAGEYAHSVLTSAIATTLFLGGWSGPAFFPPLVWMLLKTGVMFFIITWVRWSLTRLRSDQLMALCWKFLVPFSLMLLLAAGIWTHLGG
ncbi:MAG: NADH-quinone oxidoreductase subunit NuoH [Myxococcaceae bacterium]